MRCVTVFLFVALAASAAPSTAGSLLSGSGLANGQFSGVTSIVSQGQSTDMLQLLGVEVGELSVDMDITVGGGGQWWADPDTTVVPTDYVAPGGDVVLPDVTRPTNMSVPELPALLLSPMGLGALLGIRRRFSR